MDMLLNQQINSSLLEVDSILIRPPQDGNCVLMEEWFHVLGALS